MAKTWSEPVRVREVVRGRNRGRSRIAVFERGLVYGHLLAFAMLALIFSPVCTSAQDNYEIQVYGYDLVDPGHMMVELHSGSKATTDGACPTNHAQHETVEITHGFNDWFECGFYIFTSITEGQGWQCHRRSGMAVGGRSYSTAHWRSEEMALASFPLMQNSVMT